MQKKRAFSCACFRVLLQLKVYHDKESVSAVEHECFPSLNTGRPNVNGCSGAFFPKNFFLPFKWCQIIFLRTPQMEFADIPMAHDLERSPSLEPDGCTDLFWSAWRAVMARTSLSAAVPLFSACSVASASFTYPRSSFSLSLSLAHPTDRYGRSLMFCWHSC